MKKFYLLLLLLAVTLSSITGCAKGNDSDDKSSSLDKSVDEENDADDGDSDVVSNKDNDVHYAYDSEFPFGKCIYDNEKAEGEFIEPDKKLDAASLYASIDYEPYMFYGSYRQLDYPAAGNYVGNKIFDDASYMSAALIGESESYYSNGITSVPAAINFSSACITAVLAEDKRYEWAELSFATIVSDERVTTIKKYATYEIDGNKITFHIVDDDTLNKDSATLTYEYEFMDLYLTYEFSFCGPTLTLTDGNMTSQMIEESFNSYNTENEYRGTGVEGIASEMFPSIDGIYRIHFQYYGNMKDPDYFKLDEQESYPRGMQGFAKLYEDGIMDFSYTDLDGVAHSYEFLYFWLGKAGIILTDGENTYYYFNRSLVDEMESDSYFTYTTNIREEDQAEFNSLDEEQKQLIKKTRTQLLTELQTELNNHGINANVDINSGEIVLDSEILFDVNDSTLSEEGNNTVAEFMNVLSYILSEEQYNNFIRSIVIEGHTDSSGSREINEPLSYDRANAVLGKCLDTVSDDADMYTKFENLFEAVGKADDEPVLNSDGTENMDASRRVVFMLYINVHSFG